MAWLLIGGTSRNWINCCALATLNRAMCSIGTMEDINSRGCGCEFASALARDRSENLNRRFSSYCQPEATSMFLNQSYVVFLTVLGRTTISSKGKGPCGPSFSCFHLRIWNSLSLGNCQLQLSLATQNSCLESSTAR